MVPPASLLGNKYELQYRNDKSDSALARLKGEYKVSSEVILRRLLDLSRISLGEYREKKAAIEKEMEQYRKQLAAKNKEKKKGFPQREYGIFSTSWDPINRHCLLGDESR